MIEKSKQVFTRLILEVNKCTTLDSLKEIKDTEDNIYFHNKVQKLKNLDSSISCFDNEQFDYENMLNLLEIDLKKYQQKLNQIQTIKKSKEDMVIENQINKIVKEINLLKDFFKCYLYKF